MTHEDDPEVSPSKDTQNYALHPMETLTYISHDALQRFDDRTIISCWKMLILLSY